MSTRIFHGRGFVLPASVLVALSCTTNVRVRFLVPAEKDIGGIRIVALLPFSFSGARTVDSPFLHRVDAQRVGYNNAEISATLTSALVGNGYFTVLERGHVDTAVRSRRLLLSRFVETKEAVKLGRALGAEGLLWGTCTVNIVDAVTKKKTADTTVARKTRTHKPPLGSTGRTVEHIDTTVTFHTCYYSSRHTQLDLEYRLVNTATGTIAATHNIQVSSKCVAKDSLSPHKALAALGPPEARIPPLVKRASSTLVGQIAPHHVVRMRKIENGQGPRMKKATGYAKSGMWDDAKKLWDEVLRRLPARSSKNRVPALANSALYYEIMGQYDTAADLYKQCYELSNKQKYLQARNLVLARKEEVKRLREQMQRPGL